MWCSLDVQEVCKILRTNTNFGLSESEVKKRLQKYGMNKLHNEKINKIKNTRIINNQS